MVSDYIMTQSNCEARVTAPDGIALARYYIDSHGVQRLASGGFSRWEGSIGGTPPYPYPISYRSIIPRSNECQNVFSTFALSASHVAFASCRMEPVFMMTSHAAGVAAAFAIDDNVPVQSLNYNKLAAQLRADGQLLKWEAATVSTNGLILDEGDVGVTNSGGWTFGANAGGWNGDYLLDGIGSPKPARWIRYTPTFPTNGTYEVYAWWVESSNRATNAIYDIIHANTGGATVTNRVLVNQRLSSGGWFKLFTTNFNVGQGHGVIIRNDGVVTNQYVVADGVRFLGLGGAAPTSALPVIEVVASDALAGEFGPDLGRFTFVRSGDTSAPVTINFTLSGSATAPADYQIIASSVVLAAGAVATNIVVTPVADAVAEGLENLTVTVSASATYQRSALSNATVQMLDRPVDAWRAAEFTVGELSNPAISGDNADPDGDRLPNLVEFGLGLPPRSANPNPFQLIITNGVANFRHSENKAATDVTLTVEWSPDMPDWFSGPSYLQITDVMDAGAVRWLTWTVESSLTEQSCGFLRLRAQRD